MDRRSLLILRDYAVALLSVVVAVFIRWLLDPQLGNHLPLATLFGAVAVAVWYGGYRPALVATVAGFLACHYLFIEPSVHGARDAIGLALYLMSCGIIIGFGEAVRNAWRRAQERQESLRITFASMGDGLVITDAAGRIVSLNPVAETLTGWPQKEAAGQLLEDVFRIVNEQTREPVANPFKKVLAEGRVFGLANHTVLIARNGREFSIDDSAAPIRDDSGRVTGVVLVFRDVTEQRQAQRSVRFLASIVASSDDAIIGKDINGIITSWNQAAERLFGYSAKEAVGNPIAMLVPPDRAGEMPAILERVRRGEKVEHFDTVRRAKNGRLVPISLTVSPIRNEYGEIIGASKIVRDISERKEAEAALQHEKNRLHATLTSIGDAIMVTDAEGRITLMNRVAEDLTGWKEEAIGRPLDEVFRIVNEETRGRVESPVGRVIREGTVVGLANHTVLIAKDGTERPIDDSAAPIRDGEGNLTGVVLVFRDVTERRKAERAFRDSEARLRAATEQLQIVTDSMSAAVTRCSRDLRYQWVSKPYADWIGKPMEEIVDQSIVDVIGATAFEQLRPHFEQALSGQVARYEQQIHYEHLGPRWVNGVYTPVFNAGGEVEGWVAVVLDVTERKQMEEALHDADRRKNEFLATLAHELRNPLAPIRNGLELLRLTEGGSADFEAARGMMERQLTQLVRLVDDLLDVSRITRGKVELHTERINLAHVLQHAIETSRPLVQTEHHHLSVTLPPAAVFVSADFVRLAQVFSNLLNNAAKFTPEGGHITLSAERRGGEVIVAVKDNGIGVAAEHVPRLFEMFSQVAPAAERNQGGLGIGLTLAKGLVELHGGSIEARSPGPGQGAEFIVRLPVDLGVQPAEPLSPQPDGEATGAKYRILLVDDNRDTVNTMAKLLRFLGHEVETAYDGEEAVAAAESFRPEVVLLDIGLPKLNGYDAARRIREQPWGQKMLLIALTGWGQDEDRRRSKEAGFDHHLVKPIKAATLEQIMADMAGKK
ncbi:MAG TPA: PAS domain S-box protein [Gemmataceae bacterium]|jgi:PAS domain S-box-containing protein|nr:PAS domain S-box protein [Gemmataceae bacterium]